MPDHPRNLQVQGGRHAVGSKRLRIMRAQLLLSRLHAKYSTRITSAQGSRLQLETSDVPGGGSPSSAIAFTVEARPPGWTTMEGAGVAERMAVGYSSHLCSPSSPVNGGPMPALHVAAGARRTATLSRGPCIGCSPFRFTAPVFAVLFPLSPFTLSPLSCRSYT